MSPAHRYLDFPDLVNHYLLNFKSYLIYDPLPILSDRSIGVSASTLPLSADAFWVELPSMSSLVSASQIQISVVKGYGKLSIQTSAFRGGCQQLILNQGISYRQIVKMIERDRLERWRNQTTCYIFDGKGA
jgi:hypothetical protein